ncbi:MAG: AcvB/VirJ family lysyl-phosphatidylglycerol hydrolase [Gemmatimonadota bacterium]
MHERTRCAILLFALCGMVGRAEAQGADFPDLPVHALPAAGSDSLLAVILTGDGNWAEIDRVIAAQLVERGVAVVGLESRSYLNHGGPKSPDVIGRDLERLLRHYMALWKRSRVIVIGYSRGAELAPFGVSRLPADLRRRVQLLVLLAPAPNANFTFHLTDLLSDKVRNDDLAMLPEMAKLTGTRVLCVYGTEEKHSLCPLLPAGAAHVVATVGGHHLDRDFAALAALIHVESQSR